MLRPPVDAADLGVPGPFGRPISSANAPNWAADSVQKPTHPSAARSIEGTSATRAGTGDGSPVSSNATLCMPL